MLQRIIPGSPSCPISASRWKRWTAHENLSSSPCNSSPLAAETQSPVSHQQTVASLTMSEPEKSQVGEFGGDVDQIENARSHDEGFAQGLDDPAYVDHRADDDRADEARGRNADKFEKNYWLSVNYIGTLFAIGMAFAGGIGGKWLYDVSLCVKCVKISCRLWSDRASPQRDQCGHRPFTKHQLGPSRKPGLWRRFLPHGRSAVRHFR